MFTGIEVISQFRRCHASKDAPYESNDRKQELDTVEIL